MRTRASRDTSPRSATQLRIMQPEQSTSAPAGDPHATSIEQRTAEQIRTAVLASEQRITEQFLAANGVLLAQPHQPTATPATTDRQQSIPADTTLATEGGKEAPEPPTDMLDDEPHPPRPNSSTSPTTAKSSRPASNVLHATSTSQVCGHSPTTPPAL
jgi:hypothetical protein